MNEQIKEIIDHFNKLAGTKYSPNKLSKEISGFINTRLEDGYTVEDFKKVHQNKYNEWHGTDMYKYFRPSTLYRPTNFIEYLNKPREAADDELANADVDEEFRADYCHIPEEYKKSHWRAAMEASEVTKEMLKEGTHTEKFNARVKVNDWIEKEFNNT